MTNWSIPSANWSSPVGLELDRFIKEVRERLPELRGAITLFGSSPIHLCLDHSFVSADADMMVLFDQEPLQKIADELGLGKAHHPAGKLYLEICKPFAFRSTPVYRDRAHEEMRHGFKIVVPHVRDILIGKLHRFRKPGQQGIEPKDMRAFVRVREVTGGHPTEQELLEDLRLCPHYFMVGTSALMLDFRLNVEDLWPALYGRSINVNEELLKPMIADLEELGYTEGRDWVELVRALGAPRPDRR